MLREISALRDEARCISCQPGAGVLTFLVSKVKPLLASLALRAEPLSPGARLALLLAGLAFAALVARSRRRG